MDMETYTTAPETKPGEQPGRLAGALNAAQPREQSWGEKYAGKTLHFFRDILVNYIVNFIISALLTFKVLRSKFNKETIDPFIERTAEKGERHGIPRALTEFIAKFLTRVQLLLCGGHAILPFMHWTHNHRNRLEFRIGHMLDLSQEFFGRGTAASKRSLEEYHHLSSLVAIGDLNQKQLDPAAPVDPITDEDKALLAKHHINELQFEEKTKTAWQSIKARLAGMSVTITLSILMGISSSWAEKGKFNKWMWFEETYEKPSGKWLGKAVFEKLPFVGKGLRELESSERTVAGRKVTEMVGKSAMLGTFMVDEMIFTAGSKFGFDKMEKRQARKREQEERKKPAPAHGEVKHDEQFLTQIGIRGEDAADIHAARAGMAESIASREQPASHAQRRENERATAPETVLAAG